MLKTRILTASMLLPFSLWLICYANYSFFAYVTAGIVILAAYEWLKLLNIKNNLEFVGYFAIFVSMLLYIILNYNFIFKQYNIFIIFVINIIFWLLAILLIIMYSINKSKFHNICSNYPIIWKICNLISCVIVLFPSWLAINYIKRQYTSGIYCLLQVILLIIGIDCAGYLGGNIWGKRKLSIVSPNKTREGVFTSYFITILFMIIFFLLTLAIDKSFMPSLKETLYRIIVTHLILILAISGDLFESLLKRISNVKDSGNILPGHGGILDRFDSIFAVMPMVALFNHYLYHI